MFIVSFSYVKDLDQVSKSTAAHSAFIQRQVAEGVYLVAGPKVPRTGGVILARASSREALWQIVREDPYHTSGVAEFEVVEFVAGRYVPQLAPLVQQSAEAT